MRGSFSSAMTEALRADNASTSPGDRSPWINETSSAPSFRRAHSFSVGGRTFRTTSASHGVSVSSAPAATKASSGMPAS
jgi:hypothetical protein